MFHGIAVSLGGSRYRDKIREEHEHYTIMHNPTCERHLLPSLRQVDYKISEMFRRFSCAFLFEVSSQVCGMHVTRARN